MSQKKKNSRFESITYTKLKLAQDLLRLTAQCQKEWGTSGPQTTWQCAREIIFGNKLGADKVNLNKHGFDIMKSDLYHETKHDNKQATFNDTTLAKVDDFEQSGGDLYLVHWTPDGDCDYAYRLPLNNQYLVDYLRYKIINKAPQSRSTQTVSKNKLIEWGAIRIELNNRQEDYVIQQMS